MQTSTPVARWRASPFAACAYLIPAFASVLLGGPLLPPCMAAIVLGTLLVFSERFNYPIGLVVAFTAAGSVLAWMSPEHDWVRDVAIGVIWGLATLQSRGRVIPKSPVTPGFFQS